MVPRAILRSIVSILPPIRPRKRKRAVNPTDPLSFLVPLGGIALVLLAVVLAGGRRRLALDEAIAARRLAEDLPGFAPRAMLVDRHGNTVLARGADGFAVVFAAGARAAVRRLSGLDRVEVDGDRLTVGTRDFTHPRFVLTADPAAAAAWAEALRG